MCQVEADVGQAGLALRDHRLVDNGEHVGEDDDGDEGEDHEDEDGDNSEHLHTQWFVFVMVEVEDVNLAVDRDSSKDGALDGVHCKEMQNIVDMRNCIDGREKTILICVKMGNNQP